MRWLLLLIAITAFPLVAGPPGKVGYQPRSAAVGGGAFDPDSITGLTFWMKARGESFADNDSVTTITDFSGEGNNAGQPTAGNRPVFKTGIVNSQSVFRFDGSNDNVTNSVNSVGTVFAVVAFDSTGAEFRSFAGADGDSGQNREAWYFGLAGVANQTAFRRGITGNSLISAAGGTVAATTFVVLCGRVSGSTTVAQFNNGDAAGSSTSGTALITVAKTVIGAAYDSDAILDFFDGDIAELLIYSGALSDGEVDQVGDYLGDIYGITWTP
jgi:hypothetical protein